MKSVSVSLWSSFPPSLLGGIPSVVFVFERLRRSEPLSPDLVSPNPLIWVVSSLHAD